MIYVIWPYIIVFKIFDLFFIRFSYEATKLEGDYLFQWTDQNVAHGD